MQGDLLNAFNLAVAAALDPTNKESLGGGKAVTTRSSSWYHHRCPVTGHTFRAGDEVTVDTDGTVRLVNADMLKQWEAGLETGDGNEVARFFGGLFQAWPPPPELPVIRLDVGHYLLAPLRAGFDRHQCAVCGHTFRLHDLVVICPCSPHEPLCATAIHRDPIHGLGCLEAWNPGGSLKYCPVTSRPLDE